MKSLTKILIFLFWAVIILAGYFYYHKPFTPAQIPPILGVIGDLAGSFLILAVCGGLGRKILRMPASHPLTAFSLQAALGVGLVSLIWLALGVAGLIRWWAAALLLLVGFAVLRKDILAWLHELTGWVTVWQNSGNINRIFLIASAVLIANQVWFALAPPIKYDALSYHLALPSLYVREGRLIFQPDNPYWGHPQLVEMLYTWASALGRASTAAAFGWWCGIAFLTGLAGITYHHLPGVNPNEKSRASAAATAVLFVLIGATARWMLGWAYTDLFSAWMGLGVLVALFTWHEEGEGRWLIWAGLFTGLAVSTKYTAGVIAIALYLGIWLVPALRKPPLKLWLLSGLFAGCVFLPWALKNLVYTGNPLFPYLFPTQAYNVDRLADANLPSADYQILPQFILPIYLTWAGVDSVAGPSTDLGPLLVLFAIPAIYLGRKDHLVQFLGLSLLFTWLAISLGGSRYGHLNQPRLFFVMLPTLAILAGWGWTQTETMVASGIRLGRLTAVIVLLVLILVLYQDFTHLLDSGALQTIAGVQSTQAYLEENTGVYITAMDSIHTLPESSKVMMLWEARGLYAPPDTASDPWIDRWRAALRQYSSPNAVLENWRAQGFTHLLVNQAGMDFMRKNDASMTPDEWAQFDQLQALLPPPQQITGPLLFAIRNLEAVRTHFQR